jgi:hypothetical protein
LVISRVSINEGSRTPGVPKSIARLKTAPHHQKNVYIARVGCSGDVAPKDDKALQKTCTTCQRIDEFQTCGDGNALRCPMAKVCNDLGKRGPLDSDGQIAELVEGRPRHLP